MQWMAINESAKEMPMRVNYSYRVMLSDRIYYAIAIR